MSTELQAYRELVRDAMRRSKETHEPVVFENEGPDHAQIVVDAMLADSSSTLDIVAGSLDRSVWQTKSLQAFLDRNPAARVRVALECRDEGVPGGSALAGLRRQDGRVEVRRCPWQLENHLFVADARHVRFEYDKETREASVTFGDAVGAGATATEIFNDVWAASKPLAA